MARRRLIISIGAVCIFLTIGFAIALPYSGGPQSTEEPVNKNSSGDITSGAETPASDTSVPEGAIVISDEEMATETVIRNPLALRDPSTYTDEDIRLIAQKLLDDEDEFNGTELDAILKGMTDEQIKAVEEMVIDDVIRDLLALRDPSTSEDVDHFRRVTEKMVTENVIRDPLALRDPSTYTDEDIRLIAQKFLDDEFSGAERHAIAKGMTDEQIITVRAYVRLYWGLKKASDEEQ